MVGHGSTIEALAEDGVRDLLAQAFDTADFDDKRILVIIPDGTRTAPIPLIFRLLYAQLGGRVARLDYLIALGTHPPMPEEAVTELVGASPQERDAHYPKSDVFNHTWGLPGAMAVVGTIGKDEMETLTDGLMAQETPVSVNSIIFEYDHLLICGPVFPHEVAGFSGGAKYLFPGIAGPEIINNTHWLGALATSMETIGVQDTPVRRVLHRAAEMVVQKRPVTLLALVMKGEALHGLYIGDYLNAWRAAAELSAQLNIIYKPKPFSTVLSMPAPMYKDLWTGAKAMYKTEPVVADGGEVIIYAPHLDEISYTHGYYIRRVGYHVRDYFLKQWHKFDDVSLAILAHSTHVKGKGSYENGVETPRIQVTLATRIRESLCRRVNLGYRDPATIDPAEYAGREDEGVLLVEHAGEFLYRLRD